MVHEKRSRKRTCEREQVKKTGSHEATNDKIEGRESTFTVVVVLAKRFKACDRVCNQPQFSLRAVVTDGCRACRDPREEV
jgi:hypothetical protein